MKILNRAKATDNSIGYIISQSIKFKKDKMFLYSKPFKQWVECDESTRALNFEDMLDSKCNKIFASLSKDGKGGDRILEESRLSCTLKVDDSAFREFTAIHTINGNRFVKEKILSDIGANKDKHFKGYDIMIYDFFIMKKRKIEIIGIQQ